MTNTLFRKLIGPTVVVGIICGSITGFITTSIENSKLKLENKRLLELQRIAKYDKHEKMSRQTAEMILEASD